MKFIKTVVAIGLFALGSLAFAQATNSEVEEKQRLADAIVAMQGSAKDAANMIRGILRASHETMTSQLRVSNPQLTNQQLARVVELNMDYIDKAIIQFNSSVFAEIQAKVRFAYANHFSVEELRAIATFTGSETGRKYDQFNKAQVPVLMQPLMADASKFGAEAGRAFARIRQQLASEGIELK